MRAMAQQKLMWEALREAVDEEMEADPTVCLMGELCRVVQCPIVCSLAWRGMLARI